MGRIGKDGCDVWNILTHLPHHRALHHALYAQTGRVALEELCQLSSTHDGQLSLVSYHMLPHGEGLAHTGLSSQNLLVSVTVGSPTSSALLICP